MKHFDKSLAVAYPQCRFVERHRNWICYCRDILHKLPIRTQEMYLAVKCVTNNDVAMLVKHYIMWFEIIHQFLSTVD